MKGAMAASKPQIEVMGETAGATSAPTAVVVVEGGACVVEGAGAVVDVDPSEPVSGRTPSGMVVEYAGTSAVAIVKGVVFSGAVLRMEPAVSPPDPLLPQAASRTPVNPTIAKVSRNLHTEPKRWTVSGRF
jgi:hypothetical protein